MKKALPALLLLLITSVFAQAQVPVQTIRGTVVDKESNMPLIGVNVVITKDSAILNGSTTDENGHFRIERIPVGRVNLSATYMGFKPIFIPNLLTSSAKEMVMSLEMEQSVSDLQEVEIQGKRKGETINEMAVLSARQFTVEETERYAGSRGDPARMAANFAGVSGTDDSRNDIVIRGNSPFGVVYKLENVNIPNPNHFAVAGSTGGSVGILNNKVMANSDFLTGAFPAEYGNGIAGVFDIRYKNGNNERHEYTAQLGILGAELFGEGPVSKKNKSSYLFNYRYATLEALIALGIDVGTQATPKYQDLQFKFNFPQKNGDNLSIFGLGGYSMINFITSNKTKPETREIYATKDQDEFFRSGLGIVGLTYTHQVNDKVYSKVSIAASVDMQKNHFDKVDRYVDSTTGNYVVDSIFPKVDFQLVTARYSASFLRNHKVNSRLSIRYGLSTDIYYVNYLDSILRESDFTWEKRLDSKEFHILFQPYAQLKYAITERLSMVAGLHTQYYTINKKSWSIEPRFSIKWQFKPNQSVSFGTGLHSQTIPSYQYFVNQPGQRQLNKDLGFMRSFHLVAGYDVFFKKDIRIKTEIYFQQLFDLPVTVAPSSYNILNEGAGFDRFFPTKLVNKGLGRNMGVEFTLEKFFTKNWFFMFSGSLYDSRLQGSNGKWYNSDFNGNYVLNALGTKEFRWGKKRINTIGIGGKVTFGGGQRYTPFDTVLSQYSEDPVALDSMRNGNQFKPYFRLDIKLNYRCNTKRFTHEVGIDLVNLTFQKNILRLQYAGPDVPAQEVYQLGFLPLFYYRLDFWIGKMDKQY
jgi:hypothetical protein